MKILLIDTIHPVFAEKLTAKGFEVVDGTTWTREKILEHINEFVGISIRSRFKIDKSFLKQSSTLKFITRAGAGMENIDVAFAETKGIACISSPEGNRDAVGEHALGMLLMLLNRIKIADAEVRNGIWKRAENRGTEIKNKSIGIIGFGNMGSTFAKKLQGFEANILAYDPYLKIDAKKFSFVKQVEMNEIFDQTDILSLHIPLNDETLFLVNDEYINRFNKNIYIINTARGKNLRIADLVKNLKSGKVLGACLDVLEYESTSFENLDAASLPDDYKYLTQSENVILTPHIAGWTHESNYKLADVLVEKILQLKLI
ncbi:MAG: NAD(P)-dependent oxidoreductase [Bacteroidia bacterium]